MRARRFSFIVPNYCRGNLHEFGGFLHHRFVFVGE